MHISFKNALAEVEYILSKLSIEEQKRIPVKLKKFILKEKNSKYTVNITDEPFDEQELLPDTRSILAVIYRLYLATDEERDILDNILKSKRRN